MRKLFNRVRHFNVDVKTEGATPEVTVVLASVVLFKLSIAHSLRGITSAILWLFAATVLAFLEIVSLISIGVALQWPRCFSNSENACRRGTACFYINSNGFLGTATCEDCFYLAEDESVAANTSSLYVNINPGSVSPGIRFGFDNMSASDACLSLLPEGNAIYDGLGWNAAPSFRQCQFVLEGIASVSNLDRTIIVMVFVLCAMSIAEDMIEQAAFDPHVPMNLAYAPDEFSIDP